MKTHFLETKFHMPPWRTHGVMRPRLLEHLHHGFTDGHKLTLVSAPAGYGKTTLMAEWIHHFSRQNEAVGRVGWLSLDEADNDPARFLSYWVAAFCRLDESHGQSAQSLLGMPQLPPITAIFDELINELVGLTYKIILILDDYHVITNPLLHEALTYFIDHQPQQIHLALTTRADPPIALSRMRVRGQLTEIRAHHLRFTANEARQFFNQAMRLNLEPDEVTALEVRTEGWAAGLQLAALAMQNLPDHHDFLAEFSGSHRYIIDYLLDEVLKYQPLEVRAFLRETAVLPRFNAALCQAVTGNPDAAAILGQLERANLFLIPLDDQRGWYRYHHLFADALRVGLSPEMEKESRTNAAHWFEAEGLFTEAVANWLAVPEPKEAARLIHRLAADFIKNGELQTLLRWLDELPEQEINVNPDLISYKALCLLLTGQIGRARDYAAKAHQLLIDKPQSGGHGRVLSIQAWFAMTSGEGQSGKLAQAALAQLDGSELFFRAIALIVLGDSYAWQANLPAASQVFRETCQSSKQMNHPFITLGAFANLAFNLLDQGQLREADALCRAALAEYVDSWGNPLPILGIIYSPLAAICYEKGDFDEAEAFANKGIALSQRLFSSVILGGDSEIVLARIAFQRGNPEEAFALLHATATVARQRNVLMVVYKMEIVQAELYLWQGNLAEAENLLQEIESQSQSSLPKTRQIVAHLQARLWAATGQMEKAMDILHQLEQTDQVEGCVRRLIGVHMTQALAYQMQANQAPARDRTRVGKPGRCCK